VPKARELPRELSDRLTFGLAQAGILPLPGRILCSVKIRYGDLSFKPVTSERWSDLEELFGEHGAYSGCWCMWWRITRSEFDRNHGEGNRRALKRIVDSGTVPGILAYLQEKPIGWCSVAPREQFPVLDRSRMLKRVDDRPVWSIICFFVPRPYRRQGLSSLLIRGALEYAKGQGATIVEAYPVDKESPKNTSVEAFTGFAKTFRALGFREVIRRSAWMPILRYYFAD
jgi:GNAT superfamily N-acetyltransferase